MNVGQRITAFGTLTGTALDSSTTDAVVRMHKTSVFGIANAAPVGSVLTINVTRIGLRPIGQFNFTVGGNLQSTPASFTIDTGSLSTTGVDTATQIRSIGFVNPVDVSGDQDLMAESVTNLTTAASLLFVQWTTGTLTPFSAQTSALATLDVSAAQIKFVGNAFGSSPLSDSPTPAKIDSFQNLGIFRIVESGAIELHTRFDTFLQALTDRIDSDSKVFRLAALGVFDQSTQKMTAIVMSVVLL